MTCSCCCPVFLIFYKRKWRMHTPEGTLERTHHHTAPSFTTTSPKTEQRFEEERQNEDETDQTIPHMMSLPNGDVCNFADSMLYLEKGIGNLHIPNGPVETSIPINFSGATSNDSSPNMSQPPYNLKPGWMDGILGCLRPVFSLIGKANEIKENGDSWEIPFDAITIIKYLGSGGQGMVNLGKYNNQLVAVKKVSMEKDIDIRHLRKLDHKNIIKFVGVCTEPQCFAIVMEYCPHGSLYDLLKREDYVIKPTGIVTWAKQIASGMLYVHSHKIIHRDLKSLNILIGENEVIKISDFGTSRVWNEKSMQMSFNGTVAWMAPEALREDPCSEKVDIWSFGIVLWELLTREPPFRDLEHSSIIFLVGSGKLKPLIPSTCPDGFKLIMQMCWKYNPKERPSFKLICNHLEIAAVEILSTYRDEQFYKTQETWKQEVKSHITKFKEQFQRSRIELELSQEQWKRKRDAELKHIEEMKMHYKSKLREVDALRMLLQVTMENQHKRNKPGRHKLIRPFMKRLERRRSSQNSTTPTSPDLTSPDSPQIQQTQKCPLYARLNEAARPESTTMSTQTSMRVKRRHARSNSGSSRSPGCSTRTTNTNTTSSSRTVVDSETQTDYNMDLSETDLSPSGGYFASRIGSDRSHSNVQSHNKPQRVLLQEQNASDGENANSVRLLYLDPESQSEVVEVFQRLEPRTPSPVPLELDQVDALNCNAHPPYSDDDNLKVISKKVTALINGNIFSDGRNSDNGNISDDGERIYSDTRPTTGAAASAAIDSMEDCPNDSFTDEEGEVIQSYPSLRRKSILRRPIPRGRRSVRAKPGNQNCDINVSDEGNTSEYSVSPSSKSSTLESNPERISRNSPNLPTKRPNPSSDGSSDSESEDNLTIATQLCYNNTTTTNHQQKQLKQELNKNLA